MFLKIVQGFKKTNFTDSIKKICNFTFVENLVILKNLGLDPDSDPIWIRIQQKAGYATLLICSNVFKCFLFVLSKKDSRSVFSQ
jgi:hypothetical protein